MQSQKKICVNINHASLKQRSFFLCVQTVFVNKTYGNFVKMTLTRVIHCESSRAI